MKFLLFAAAISLQLIAAAQNVQVTGVVLEETHKGKFRPIEQASVYWLGTTAGTFTDSLGVFSLPVSTETRRLVITYLGFHADTITVGGPDKITVILKNATNLKEVTVEYRSKSTSVSKINPLKVQQIGQKELFKAACCNLSESFETNPSVDVAYTDAVTGAKQIQLLGLAGPYTQITTENIPAIRGLSAIYGLGQIPGTWVESMQLAKGTGSVVNGYESIAGQLNVELHKPNREEKFILNGYAGMGGRIETNAIINQNIGSKWSTGLLMHASGRVQETDQNNDGFMDNPLGTNYSLMNRWDYQNEIGLESQLGISIATEDRNGGQLTKTENRYRFGIRSEKYEAFAKTGYVFPGSKYKSVGLQLSARRFGQAATFGTLNSYDGEQDTYYANLIYQSIIGTTDHTFRTGLSFLTDDYREKFNKQAFVRKEVVPGAFFEYTWTASDKFSAVAGLRGDANSVYGNYLSPRIHLRYEVAPKNIVRFSGGLGRKSPAIFTENNGLMATSRAWIIPNIGSNLPYGLKQEVATNLGINYTRHFELDFREGTFSVEYYRTDFINQVVTDMDATAREVRFYNLNGASYANSTQVELDYELLKHFDVRLAYRYYDVKTQYGNQLLQRPLVAKNRAFINLAYETQTNWSFDFTANWIGQKRLASTQANPEEYRFANYSPNYYLFSAQVTKKIATVFEAYIGMENIANYRQNQAILAASDPNGSYFDSSMIWGPVFGRMTYIGFRYTLKKK